MKLLSILDLADRWNYTRAGIHKLVKKPEFPQPIVRVSRSRIPLFEEADIAGYEQGKPWLFDEEQKRRRQHLYGLLNQAKGKPEAREAILQQAFGAEAKDWIG